MKPNLNYSILFFSYLVFVCALTTGQSITTLFPGTVYSVVVASVALWYLRDTWLGHVVLGLTICSILIVYLVRYEAGVGPLVNRLFSIGVLVTGHVLIRRYAKVWQEREKFRNEMQMLFTNTDEAVLFFDDNQIIVKANPAASRIFQYKNSEFHGMHLSNLLRPEYQICVQKSRDEKQAGKEKGANHECSLMGITKSGTQLPLELTITRNTLDGSSFDILVAADVSEKKQKEAMILEQNQKLIEYNLNLEEIVKSKTAELELALHSLTEKNNALVNEIEQRSQIEAKLMRSERLHSAIAANIPDAVVAVVDSNMNYVFLHGKEVGLTQLVKGYVGVNNKFLHRPSIPLLSKVEEKLAQVFGRSEVEFEMRFQEKYYEVIATMLPNDDLLDPEMLVVIRNVTNHKRINERLLKALEKERSLNELKSRFVSSVSHEFRTPLTNILSAAFLLENYPGADAVEQRRSLIEQIRLTVKSMVAMLNDFLEIGKLDEKKLKPALMDVDIVEMLDQVVSETSTLVKRNQKIELRTTNVGHHLLVYGQLLKNVLVNLVSNAIKYSPEGGEIVVTALIEDGFLSVDVADQGRGISRDDQPHIFERFFRGRNVADVQGTGLGLSISQEYMKLLGGNIIYKSEPGKGSIFSITLPVTIIDDDITTKNPTYGTDHLTH